MFLTNGFLEREYISKQSPHTIFNQVNPGRLILRGSIAKAWTIQPNWNLYFIASQLLIFLCN